MRSLRERGGAEGGGQTKGCESGWSRREALKAEYAVQSAKIPLDASTADVLKESHSYAVCSSGRNWRR